MLIESSPQSKQVPGSLELEVSGVELEGVLLLGVEETELLGGTLSGLLELAHGQSGGVPVNGSGSSGGSLQVAELWQQSPLA